MEFQHKQKEFIYVVSIEEFQPHNFYKYLSSTTQKTLISHKI